MSNTLNLEDMLFEKDDMLLVDTIEKSKIDACKIPHGGTAKDMQRAKKNASLYDFLDMVAKIVDYSMEEDKVIFLTDEQQAILKDPETVVNNPYISYRVVSRKPKNEYKPIIREEIVEHDENNEQRYGQIFGQYFDCTIQFNIFANENKIANKVMENFEKLMLEYSGHFKEQGVVDLFFKEQLTDSDFNNFRKTLSVRNIRYYVQIEKLTVIFNRRVTDIKTAGDIKNQKK